MVYYDFLSPRRPSMARKPRLHVPGALYHVIWRGNEQRQVFFDEDDCYRFYALLEEGVSRFGYRVHGFCLMPNHVHLALQAGKDSLSRSMQNLAFRYTQATNRKLGRSGHLFQGRYKALLVDRDAYLLELVRYIHLNPVRARLVADLADYPWSGHQAYLGKVALPWLTRTLLAAGRVLFAPIPNVQPVTVMVAAAGVALGPRRGFAVGAIAALASNMFLGQGSHTPWQMLAWGGCGAAAGVARPLLRGRLPFAAFSVVLGFGFGTLLDLWLWFGFYPHTWAALVTVLGTGFAFNVAHATGNLVLALVAGPELRRVLDRYARRSRTEVVWA